VEAYKEVLTVDPQNLPALKALEQLYEKAGRMDAYLEVLEHQLQVTASEADRVNLLERMAQVCEQLPGKIESAIDSLQQALAINPQNLKVCQDLERLYRSERKWDALVDTFRKHIQVETDVAAKIALYLDMGRVYEEGLRDPDNAIEAFNEILNADPDHAEALTGLARLYEETEQWERAVDIMQRLVGRASSPRRSTSATAWARYSTSRCRCRTSRGASQRRLGHRPHARAEHVVHAQHLQAAG